MPKHSVGAEIGVQRGGFSAHMVDLVEPKLLYLIDCWADLPKSKAEWGNAHYKNLRVVSGRFAEQCAKGIVRVICAKSADAAAWIPDKSLDWVYIDACHEYEAVKADIEAYSQKVKHGGILSGHDYGASWPGVVRAVHQHAALLGVGKVEATDPELGSWWYVKP